MLLTHLGTLGELGERGKFLMRRSVDTHDAVPYSLGRHLVAARGKRTHIAILAIDGRLDVDM